MVGACGDRRGSRGGGIAHEGPLWMGQGEHMGVPLQISSFLGNNPKEMRHRRENEGVEWGKV